MIKRLLSFFLAICFLISVSVSFDAVMADESTTAPVSAEEQRESIEAKLRDIESKLRSFNDQSKETEEYINVLNEKISYLNEQFELTRNEVSAIEKKVSSLEKSIGINEKEIASLQTEIKGLEGDILTLNKEFAATYTLYCQRIRAIYVSGKVGTSLGFLLESDGIQNLLTRFEMVRAISKRDGELLSDVKEQTEIIVSTKEKLDKKRTTLTQTQTKLESDRVSLQTERADLLKKEDEMEEQRSVIEDQQHEANSLLQRLHDKTLEYGEYRNITQAELDAIDAEIAAADAKYKDPKPTTVSTTTTTEPTTKKKKKQTTTTTTEAATTPDESESTTKKKKTTTTKKETTTKKKKTTTTTTTTTTEAQAYIRLTYPCPKYKTITCAFGAYPGHTGCDFSTQHNENQRIVASESGTVILVKLLEYSYGHYLVIRHDKTTRSGKTVYTLYAHNNDIIVSEGQYVKKGQKIANSGTTGNSTGPHCHFEVRVGGSSQSYAVNPAYYLP